MIGRRLGFIERIVLIAGMIAGGTALSGCNENYLLDAASRGYGIRSGTPEGYAAGEIIGDCFGNEGNRETSLDSKTQIIIVNPDYNPTTPRTKEEIEVTRDAVRRKLGENNVDYNNQGTESVKEAVRRKLREIQ